MGGRTSLAPAHAAVLHELGHDRLASRLERGVLAAVRGRRSSTPGAPGPRRRGRPGAVPFVQSGVEGPRAQPQHRISDEEHRRAEEFPDGPTGLPPRPLPNFRSRRPHQHVFNLLRFRCLFHCKSESVHDSLSRRHRSTPVDDSPAPRLSQVSHRVGRRTHCSRATRHGFAEVPVRQPGASTALR